MTIDDLAAATAAAAARACCGAAFLATALLAAPACNSVDVEAALGPRPGSAGSDTTAPSLLTCEASPALVGAEQLVEIRIVASEPLAALSSVTLGSVDLTEQCNGDAAAYTCTYTTPAQPGSDTGPQAITVSAEDTAGNRLEDFECPGGGVDLDYAPPVLSNVAVSPNPVGLGKDALVSFEVDEPLGDIPVVQVSLGTAVIDALVYAAGDSSYVGSVELPASLPDGTFDISISAVDRVGNRSVASTSVLKDFTAPALSAPTDVIHVGQAAVGAVLVVELDADEPVSQPSATFGGRPADATCTPSTAAYCVARTIDGTEVGDIVVAAEDAAGNVGSLSLAADFDFDAPQLTILARPAYGAEPATTVAAVIGNEPLPLQSAEAWLSNPARDDALLPTLVTNNLQSIFSMAPRTVPDGTYNLVVRITDAAGNASEESVLVDIAHEPTLPPTGTSYIDITAEDIPVGVDGRVFERRFHVGLDPELAAFGTFAVEARGAGTSPPVLRYYGPRSAAVTDRVVQSAWGGDEDSAVSRVEVADAAEGGTYVFGVVGPRDARAFLRVTPAYSTRQWTGTGSYSVHVQSGPGSTLEVLGLALADFDRDGAPEVITLNETGVNDTYLGLYRYDFQDGSIINERLLAALGGDVFPTDFVRIPAVADFDASGYLDAAFVVSHEADANLYLLLDPGGPASSVAIMSAEVNTTAVSAGDTDGDGWPESRLDRAQRHVNQRAPQ